jgi:peptidoglycan/LPS O-acetylase OafA/YrhL
MNIFSNSETQSQKDKSHKYMVQLDGLRAIAVLGVLVSHFLPENLPINSIFQPGSLGVRLFFVLSGFLITGILLKCKNTIDETGQSSLFTIKRFYIRRFLRIFPIYYLILFIVALVNLESVRDAFFWHFTYTSNIYFQIKGAWDIGTAHFWTLCIEEQFYLIWPFIIIFISKQKLPILLIVSLLLGPLFRALCLMIALNNISTMGNLLTLAWVDSLSLGAVLAYLTYEEEKLSHFKKTFCDFCFWVGIPLFVTLHILRIFHPILIFDRIFATTIISLVFTWIIARAAKGFNGMVGSILEQNVIVYFGKISYGIYVYHLFIPWINKYLFDYFNIPFPKSIYIQFVINIVNTLIVAIVSYHLIEHPINGWKKYFEYTKK